jgi:hypothetical protein
MAEIVDLSQFRKKPVPTVLELAEACSEQLLSDWERAAKSNKLSEFFSTSAMWADEKLNYLHDLNATASLESKCQMQVGVVSPGILNEQQFGWRAYFYLGGKQIFTPDLPFESYARCFNLLLFQKLKRELVRNGYSV